MATVSGKRAKMKIDGELEVHGGEQKFAQLSSGEEEVVFAV